MCQQGGNDIWECTESKTQEVLGVSVWLPPGVQVAIPFKSLFPTALSALSTVGISGVKKIKRYLQVRYFLIQL
jgi:hypothetical protein